jgi:hypothetical protein
MKNCSLFRGALSILLAVLLVAVFFLLQILFLNDIDESVMNRGNHVGNSSIQYSSDHGNVAPTATTFLTTTPVAIASYSATINSNNDDVKNLESCATWLPKHERKILLVGFQPLENLSWTSDEFHLTRGLSIMLPRLRFDVEYMTQDAFQRTIAMMKEQHQQDQEGKSILLHSYHQIFYMRSRMEQPMNLSDLCTRGIISCCNMRVIYPDIRNDEKDKTEIEMAKLLLHEKQILTVSPLDGSTDIPSYYSFPFISREMNGNSVLTPRNIGSLYVSQYGNIHEVQKLVRILLKKGLEVHIFLDTAMDDDRSTSIKAMKNAHIHSNMMPNNVSSILAKSVFLAVWGDNFPTFLSLLTLSYGASVIQIQPNSDVGRNRLAWFLDMGMPYVYRVEIGDTKSIIKAVNDSVNYRFLQHEPISPGEFEDVLCALIEDDSVCECHVARSKGDDIDCQSSFYMKKSTIFPQPY